MSHTRQLVIAAVVIAVVPWLALSQTPAGGQPTFRSLLDAGDYDYVEDGDYLKVYVSIDGEATLVIGQEAEVGDERIVAMWAVVVEVPDGFRHPPAMLRKIADLNGSMTIGNVGLYEGTVIYSSSFWLRGADDTVLAYELTLAHYQSGTLRAELRPFVEEGS